MGKPTECQVAMLAEWGIAVPPTEQSAKSIVSFVLRGNYTIGVNEFARREIVRKAQSQWIGKCVRAYGRETGTVMYLRAKWQREVSLQREFHKEEYGKLPSCVRPFFARFKPDGGGTATEISLGDLELLDEA